MIGVEMIGAGMGGGRGGTRSLGEDAMRGGTVEGTELARRA